MHDFLNQLVNDDDTKLFYDYFLHHYANRPELWAFCFHENCGINTNMHLESLHQVIKHTYMDGKKCKRLDVCISHLLNVVKDKTWTDL